MVEDLCSYGIAVYWLLLVIIMCLPLAIWFSLGLAGLGVSVWSLPPMSLGCSRYSVFPVSLIAAKLLKTVGY